MGVKEDIEKMYESLYNSKLGALEQQRNEALLQLNNREAGIKNQYTETESNINKSRTDTQNSYLDRYTKLDRDFEAGQKKYYNDKDNAALSNSRNTQAIRDYMARANLIQSGESVDALLRNQTDFTNTKNSIYNQENEFNRNVDNTRSQYKRDEASAYAGLDNQLAAAMREKDLNLAAILAERDQAQKSYTSNLNSIRSEIDYNKIKDLNAYNQMLEERAYNERLAAQSAAARSYSSGGSGGGGGSQTMSKGAMKSSIDTAFNETYSSGDLNALKGVLNDAYTAYLQGYLSNSEYNTYEKYFNNLKNIKERPRTDRPFKEMAY